MVKYVIKRVILAIITAFIILSLTFILIELLPFKKEVGQDQQVFAYYERQVSLGFLLRFGTPQTKYGDIIWSYTGNGKFSYYYYQPPIMQRYFQWLSNIFTRWDWGVSRYIKPNVSAVSIIGSRLGVSIKLNVFSVIFSVPIGIGLGILAALKKNKPTDHIISTLVMILISLPGFVLISFLMLLFCYNLHWFPTQWPSDTAPLAQQIKGYIIPVFCLSLGSICGYTRFVRAELCEVMSSEYLLLARTKGLTRKQAIMRHALRNAMVPIFPSILAEFIGILGGSMILENLYGIQGIGFLFVTALNAKDYNVLFVDMAIFTTMGLLAGVVLDLSYGFIDPRIRMGAKK